MSSSDDGVKILIVEDAKAKYRKAWLSWLDANTPHEKGYFEGQMDGLQAFICKGPCPEWREFTATLPGYDDYWQDHVGRAMELIRQKGVEQEGLSA